MSTSDALKRTLKFQKTRIVQATNVQNGFAEKKDDDTIKFHVPTPNLKSVKDSVQSIKAWAYNMTGHIEQTVERYLELSGKEESELKPVEAPCLDDHMFPPEDFQTKGKP